MNEQEIKARLEYIRQEIRAERVSYGELCELQSLLRRALSHSRLLRENETLKRDLVFRGALGRLVGNSRAMQEVFSLIRQAAPTPVSVLIRVTNYLTNPPRRSIVESA